MQVATVKPSLKYLGVLLLTVFVMGAFGGEAQASSSWKNLRGHSACGGVDEQGQLQPACAFQKATYVKKSIKKCPDGSFAAAGACYSCPSGYEKDALRKVTHEKACFKMLSKAQTSPAKKLGSAKCPGGSVYDGRNGGECWTCPSGFGRTAAAVDKWNACGKIGKKAQSAIFVKKACPVAGSIRDPRNGGECWQCPEEFSRTGNAVTAEKACKTNKTFAKATKVSDKKCAPGEIFDFIDGGTCWTCPEGSKRTINGIKSAKACRNNKMQWVMPERQVYGLFGLGVGGEDILAKLIADRTQIDAAAKKVAQIGGKDEAVMLKEAWEIIDTHPENSAILSAVLGQYIVEAAAKPISEQTASEKDLLKRTAQLIQWNRQFIAYQAKQAHENFIATGEAESAKYAKAAGAAIIYMGSGPTPPDYNEALVASIQASAGIAGPVGAAIMPLLSTGVKSVLLPFRSVSEEVIKNGVKTVIQRSAQAAGTGMSTGSVMTAAAAGPMVIALAAGVIVTMEFDKLMAMEKADGQIRQSIDIANRTVNVGTLLQQKDGAGEFLFHWAAVIGAPTKPSANFNRLLAAYKSGTTGKPSMPTINGGTPINVQQTAPTTSVQTMMSVMGNKWFQVPGAANDIARADDGTTYIVSTEPFQTVFKIYKQTKTSGKWTNVPGAASRIAVSGNTVWIIGRDGSISSQTDAGWKSIGGPKAQDIGASAKGVWIVGVDGKIYQRAGNGWKLADGNALRIGVDSDGRPWVVTKAGNVFVHGNNLKWQKISGAEALDVSVDVPGAAHIVGRDGSIYVRDGKAHKWTPISRGGDNIAITVGGDEVWSVNKANDIFRFK